MSIETVAEVAARSPRSRYVSHATLGPLTTLALAVVILATAVLVNVAGIGITFILAAGGLEASQAPEAQALTNPAMQASLIVSTFAGQIIAIVLAVWFAGFKGGRRSAVLALAPAGGGVLTYLASAALFVAAAVAAGFVIGTLLPHDPLEDLRLWQPFLQSPAAPFMLLLIVVGAPLSEELLFRGFLFSALARSRIGLIGASLVSTALWTLPHAGYSLQGMLTVFIVGLALCAILVRTGSLRVTIFCHAVYNAGVVVFMLFFMPVPGA